MNSWSNDMLAWWAHWGNILAISIPIIGALVGGVYAIVAMKANDEITVRASNAAQKKISELEEKTRPPTTAEKLSNWAAKVSPRLLEAMKSGKRVFGLHLRADDYGALKKIAQEDSKGRIQIEVSSNTRMDSEGPLIEIKLKIDESLLGEK